MFSEIAEIALVAARLGQFLQFLKTRVILILNRPFQGFFRHLVGGAKILGRARGQTVKTWRTL